MFVLPPTRPECAARVRIFTPAREVPFAGHPDHRHELGAGDRGRLPRGATRFVLEERIGPVPVELEGDPAAPALSSGCATATRRSGPSSPNRAGVAAALGLDRGGPACRARPSAPARPATRSCSSRSATGPRSIARALDVPRIEAALGERHQPRRLRLRARPGSGGPAACTRGCSRRTPRAFPRIPPRARPAGRSAPIWCCHGLVTPGAAAADRQRAGHEDGPPELRPHQPRDARRAGAATSGSAAASSRRCAAGSACPSRSPRRRPESTIRCP